MKKLTAVIVSLLLAVSSGMVYAKNDKASKSQSDEHISEQGMENTNGVNAEDKDKGQARAEDRQSDKSQGHMKGKGGKGKGMHGKKHMK